MAETPVRRAYQVYLYAVCFVAVLVFLFAASLSLFGLVRVAAPDQTAPAGELWAISTGTEPEQFVPGGPAGPERTRGLAQFLNNAILSGFAGLVFGFHWRRAGRLRDSLEEDGEL